MTTPYLRLAFVMTTMLLTLATAAALCAQGQNDSDTLEAGAVVLIVFAVLVVLGTFVRIKNIST